LTLLVMTDAGGAADRPRGAENAALRYWMAFAQLENPIAARDVARRLVPVAEGRAPWTAELAPVVDRNVQALRTMHRGAQLAACDWGLEAELLAAAPVAHVARAHALWRLNVLYALRLVEQGRSAEAADAWLAGLQFASHVSKGPLIAAYVAAGAQRAHLATLVAAVLQGKFDRPTLRRLEQAVAAMPEHGFDWSSAVAIELGMFRDVVRLAQERDTQTLLAAYFPRADGTLDRRQAVHVLGLGDSELDDRARVVAILSRVEARYRDLEPRLLAALRAHVGSSRLFEEIDARATADPVVAKVWSSTVRVNDARGQVAQARAELLRALRARLRP
jgi:hypothetical protein